jgi:hypothetical protein
MEGANNRGLPSEDGAGAIHYGPNDSVLIATGWDKSGEVAGYRMSVEDLHVEVQEMNERALAADKAVARLDRVAAEVLPPVDYGVYRVMREHAHLMSPGRRSAVDREIGVEPVAQVVKREMQYEYEQGARLAMQRVQKTLQKANVDVENLSPKAQARLAMSTDDAVKAAIDARPARPAKKRPGVDLE